MKRSRQRIFVALFLMILLSACGSGASTPTDREASITAAAMTAARTASPFLASPTSTTSPTPEASPTLLPTGTPSPSATRPAVVTGPLCDDSLYVSDVTIPDGTVMDPGEEFTKTWRIKNTGECDWTTAYGIAFVSGSAMDGTATALPDSVESGEAIDISVEMTAPKAPGTYTGYWRLKNASGAFFGWLVFVQIVVPGGGTITPTATATEGTPLPSSTPTETPTETTTSEGG